ncbi:MAG: Proline--tRNA ligase [Candidatus Woesearchaeota archaeon]|nr:Proline--tRNA ligase [Candidatus Woesearchaeota archaeon]
MQEIKDYLSKEDIDYKAFEHPPVFTCEDVKQHKHLKKIRGVHSKNLLLKDKKSRNFYLVIIPENKRANLKELSLRVNKKLKFANEDDLKNILNTDTGAVSPFGLIFDKDKKTEVLVDKKIWYSDFVSFHPNINTETLEIKGKDFQKFIKSLDNKKRII